MIGYRFKHKPTLLIVKLTYLLRQEVELHEEPECQRVFSSFLEFLYTCHVTLGPDTALPTLVLADKYNVVDLRDVCIRFARAHVIPKLQLKEVFHVWFQYATRYMVTALPSLGCTKWCGRVQPRSTRV
jgi:hypothetical protein